MDIRVLEDIKGKMMHELKGLANKQTYSIADIEAIDRMTHTVKSICGVIEKEGGGMSGSYGAYDGGMSGARHYVRGHYSNDGINMGGGPSSYDDGRSYMRDRMSYNMDGMYSDARDEMGRYRDRM